MIEYVVGFMFNKSLRQVVLIKKVRPDWQKGKYNGPGGKCENNESALQAIIREFEEETGYITAQMDWKLHVILKKSNLKVYFFTAIGNITRCQTVTDEEISIFSVDWISQANVIPNLKWIIPLCLDDQLITPIEVLFQ